MTSPEKRLELSTPAFDRGMPIPARYTCDGADVSPPFEWTGAPPQTLTYALVADDPDAPAGTWVHWVAWNIPQPRLAEDVAREAVLADGTCQGRNSWGRVGYGGPCPPSGEHRYFFRVYAVDRRLELPPSTDKDDLVAALRGHVLAEGEILGVYSRRRAR